MIRMAVRALVVAAFAGCLAGCSGAPVAKPGPAPGPAPVVKEVPAPVPAAPQAFEAGKVYFAYNEAGIPADRRDQLNRAADVLLARADVSVNVEGYCDERGTDQYNIDLGWKRAYAVRDYLMRMGIDEKRLYPISYGRSRPAVIGDTEAAWTRNRRAEIVERK